MALKKAGQRFNRDFGELAGFSERLGELMPLAAYQAVDPIFEDRVGESASPSPEQ